MKTVPDPIIGPAVFYLVVRGGEFWSDQVVGHWGLATQAARAGLQQYGNDSGFRIIMEISDVKADS